QQPDGKLLGVVWFDNNGTTTTAIIRMNADGTVDGAFGLFGRAWFAPPTFFGPIGASLLSDGRIAVVGVGASTAHPGEHTTAMAMLAPTGAPDPTFGTNGLAVSTIAPDGNEGVGVVEEGGTFFVGGDRRVGQQYDFSVVGFDATGGAVATTPA